MHVVISCIHSQWRKKTFQHIYKRWFHIQGTQPPPWALCICLLWSTELWANICFALKTTFDLRMKTFCQINKETDHWKRRKWVCFSVIDLACKCEVKNDSFLQLLLKPGVSQGKYYIAWPNVTLINPCMLSGGQQNTEVRQQKESCHSSSTVIFRSRT